MSKYAIFGTAAESVETIKGNGWDVNSERIELNGINAELICEDDYRCVSMNGPAVEDIFKCLRDLIKENETLTEKNERLAKENQKLETYCKELREYFNAKIERRDERIRELEEENAKLKAENFNLSQDLYLKEINKQFYKTDIQDHKFKSLKEMLNDEKMNEKTINYCMNDVMMTQKVYDTDITRMYPSTYSDAAKDILNWIDGEMKNDTDYATKIFNKEDVENMFSVTFCKVPAKSEEDE